MSGTSEGPAPAADLDRAAVTESDACASHSYRAADDSYASRPALPARSFTAAPLAMAVVDREGLVVGANDAFGALLGAARTRWPAGSPPT